MIIKSATFVASSQKLSQCPASRLPEYAFIGRSNVGKSSLINMLTGHKKLAHTSATPGKTQLINHFIINSNWHLVDLPGYGYARSSKVQRATFADIITQYVTKREQLTLLFILIDCRLEPQQIDLDFITQMATEGIPIALIFTKADKLGGGELSKNLARYKKTLLTEWEELPPIFVTSAESGAGREEVLKYIDETNSSCYLQSSTKIQ